MTEHTHTATTKHCEACESQAGEIVDVERFYAQLHELRIDHEGHYVQGPALAEVRVVEHAPRWRDGGWRKIAPVYGLHLDNRYQCGGFAEHWTDHGSRVLEQFRLTPR